MLEPFWTTLPLGPGVSVIGADGNGLAALAKPAGVLSHPNDGKDAARSLLTVPYEEEGEYYRWAKGTSREGERRLYLLNRLDSGTSGVILVASHESLAVELRQQFRRQKIYKAYIALVFGIPHPAVQDWRDRLAVEKKGGVIRTSPEGNIPAEARMTVLAAHPGSLPLALISLVPKTGRSHQLRVQCAVRRFPIVGDATYGDFTGNRHFAKLSGHKRLFLHSAETRLEYTWAGRKWSFSAQAPLPEEFRSDWARRR